MKKKILAGLIAPLLFLILACNPDPSITNPESELDEGNELDDDSAWIMLESIPYYLTMCSLDSNLYIGTENDRLKSNDGGITWISINGNLPVSTGWFEVWTDGTYIYTEVHQSPSSEVYKSTDGGATWQPFCNFDSYQVEPITDLKHFEVAGDKLFAFTDDKIFVSQNMGGQWQLAFHEELNIGSFVPCWAKIAVNGNTIFTSNYASPIVSTDGGLNFEADYEITYATTGNIGNIVFNGNDAFCGGSLINANDSDSTICMRTSDDGLSWQSSRSGIEETVLQNRALFISENGVLYMAISNKVYQSEDNGLNWIQVGSDVTDCSPCALTYSFFKCNNRLYYGKYYYDL